MRKIVGVFVVTTLVVSMQLFGVVIHAPNLEVIEKEVSGLGEDAWVVFDVDYTLIVYKDCVLAPCGNSYMHGFINKLKALQEEGETIGSNIHLQAQVSLVDEKVLPLLETLKEKKIKTIALTAIPTGKFGLIPNMEEWRVGQLASLGIHFHESFPSIDSLLFTEFEGNRSLPVFKQGVLASARYPKGKVLAAFLKKLDEKPSKIIFIDDTMEYIDSVESELDKENIEHISFHYTAATDRSCDLDERLADFQCNHLMEHGEWLSDEEAKKQMHRSS